MPANPFGLKWVTWEGAKVINASSTDIVAYSKYCEMEPIYLSPRLIFLLGWVRRVVGRGTSGRPIVSWVDGPSSSIASLIKIWNIHSVKICKISYSKLWIFLAASVIYLIIYLHTFKNWIDVHYSFSRPSRGWRVRCRFFRPWPLPLDKQRHRVLVIVGDLNFLPLCLFLLYAAFLQWLCTFFFSIVPISLTCLQHLPSSLLPPKYCTCFFFPLGNEVQVIKLFLTSCSAGT